MQLDRRSPKSSDGGDRFKLYFNSHTRCLVERSSSEAGRHTSTHSPTMAASEFPAVMNCVPEGVLKPYIRLAVRPM